MWFFPTYDREVWPVTFAVELDLDRVKMSHLPNIQVKAHFFGKHIYTHTGTDCFIRPLKWSAIKWSAKSIDSARLTRALLHCICYSTISLVPPQVSLCSVAWSPGNNLAPTSSFVADAAKHRKENEFPSNGKDYKYVCVPTDYCTMLVCLAPRRRYYALVSVRYSDLTSLNIQANMPQDWLFRSVRLW